MTDETLPLPESPSPKTSSPESWPSTLGRIVRTPVGDLARGRVAPSSLTLSKTIEQAELPAELASLVQSVVRTTRLWRAEQIDVARELAGHFRDGLEAGASDAELRERFGDPRLASRLIRKSRIRCRSALWHTWRYSLWSVAALILMYVGLSAKFFLSKPTITRHYVQELNDRTKAIPEDQWAWPLYRQALKVRKPYPKLKEDQPREFMEGWWSSGANEIERESLPWQQMRTFAEENQAALQLIHQGAAKPNRGIIYGDPEDHPHSTINPDPPVFETLLGQVQEMRAIARLVSADAIVAAEKGNGDRVSKDLLSLISVAEQARGFTLIEDLVATAITQLTMTTLRDILVAAPQLLTDEQWVEIAHRLAVYYGGGTIRFDLRGEQWMLDDLLQRCYTDDGDGDGTLTPEGFKLLTQFASNDWLADSRDGKVKALGTMLAPMSMLRAMGRRESKDIQDRLFAEVQATRAGPLYTWTTPNPVDEFFQQHCGGVYRSPQEGKLLPAYSIPLLFFPALEQCEMAAERLCQMRDGTLTAIALELYRRRHGDWPASLEQLVPKYLPELPMDRFTGKTLGYRLQDGRPVVYAVGFDLQDDGGRAPDEKDFHRQIFQKPQKPLAPGEGYDWVFFPRPRRVPDAE